jgi:hypothetical protein
LNLTSHSLQGLKYNSHPANSRLRTRHGRIALDREGLGEHISVFLRSDNFQVEALALAQI